jgi:anaerobic ribonucleoside-triphosphate reductase activating protein
MNIILPVSTTFLDYPDNESVAILVFVTGCKHNCWGCHNPTFQDRTIGTVLTPLQLLEIIEKESLRSNTDRVVLSGGDPASPDNINDTKLLLSLLFTHGYKTVLYTGHSVDYVRCNNVKGFTYVKCGRYNEKLKQEQLKTDEFIQFASSNQELYDSNFNLLSQNGRYFF